MSILDAIPAGSLVALDTVTQKLFQDGFGKGAFRAACSLLVLGEVLVQPLARSRTDLADQYRRILASGPDLTV